jgi:hypothetical protein
MSETPEHIEKMDWRIQGLTWITEAVTDPSTGRTIPAGAAVTTGALMKYQKGRVGTAIPNATALFLNLSQAFHTEANALLKKCINDKDEFGKLPDDESFGFFERMMGSVVFACTALEAFVNEQIPDEYTYVDQSEKRFTRSYDKEQIERQLNLDIKLGEVLPLALSVKSLKGGKLWGAFIRLRELRDRIIHMKTKDREFKGEDATSIWNALLCDPLPETHMTAKRIIEHFLIAKGTPPRWFQKCPF